MRLLGQWQQWFRVTWLSAITSQGGTGLRRYGSMNDLTTIRSVEHNRHHCLRRHQSQASSRHDNAAGRAAEMPAQPHADICCCRDSLLCCCCCVVLLVVIVVVVSCCPPANAACQTNKCWSCCGDACTTVPRTATPRPQPQPQVSRHAKRLHVSPFLLLARPCCDACSALENMIPCCLCVPLPLRAPAGAHLRHRLRHCHGHLRHRHGHCVCPSPAPHWRARKLPMGC